MPEKAKHEEQVFLAEHIASRKDWGTYVELVSQVRRSVVEETDDFLAHIHVALDKALRERRETAGR